MHLQDQAGGGDLLLQPAVDPHHGNLDDIRSGPLDGHIHRHPLAEGPLHPVGGTQLRQGTAAAEQRFGVALLLRFGDGTFQIGGDAAVRLFVVFDILVRFLHRNADITGKGKCADTVDDAEIHRLGTGTHLGGDKRRRQVKDLGGGFGMDILPAAERFDHSGILGQSRQHPQLDLGIIRVHQQIPLLRFKEIAHPAARLGTDGDILHIGFGAADAPGARFGLVEHRTDAAVRPDGLLQPRHIGGGKLFVLAVLQDLADDGMVRDQLLQYVGVGGIAAFGLLFGGQPQSLKQYLRQLAGGIDVELAAGQLVDLLLQRGDQAVQIDAEFPQALPVDAKAGQLHRGQHLAERLFHLPQQLLLAVLLDLFFQERTKLHQAHALPGQRQQTLRGFRRRQAKTVLCQLAFHAVVAGVGVQQIAGQSGIHVQVGKAAALPQRRLPEWLGVGGKLRVWQGKDPLPQGGAGGFTAQQLLPGQQAQGNGGPVLRPAGGKRQRPGKGGKVGLLRQRGKGRRGGGGGGFGGLRLRLRRSKPQPGDQPVELQAGKEGVQRAILPGGGGQLAPGRHRRLAADGTQLTAEKSRLAALSQLFAQPGGDLQFLQMVVDIIDAVVFLDQGQRTLFPDTRHAGDIIGAVAHQGLDLDEFRRRDAVFFLHGGGVHPLVLRALRGGFGQNDTDAPGDELQRVPVAGTEEHLVACLLPPSGQTAQQIVRLVALHFQNGIAQQPQQLLDQRHLPAQLLGHPLAGPLVRLVHPVTKGGGVQVEGKGDGIRLLLLDELVDDIEKAVDGVGVNALSRGEQPHPVKGAVDDAVGIKGEGLHANLLTLRKKRFRRRAGRARK